MNLAQLRSYKLFDIALFDLILSAIGMIIVFVLARNKYFPALPYEPFVMYAVALTIPVGIVFHVLTGTNTAISYKLGLSNPVV